MAAVSGACQEPHDQVARAADKGVGSLLALRGERADIAAARLSTWLAKPKGMPYDEFYAATQAVLGLARGTLWRRQMVLGPTPEFGILSAEPVPLQDAFQPLQRRIALLDNFCWGNTERPEVLGSLVRAAGDHHPSVIGETNGSRPDGQPGARRSG